MNRFDPSTKEVPRIMKCVVLPNLFSPQTFHYRVPLPWISSQMPRATTTFGTWPAIKLDRPPAHVHNSLIHKMMYVFDKHLSFPQLVLFFFWSKSQVLCIYILSFLFFLLLRSQYNNPLFHVFSKVISSQYQFAMYPW